MDEDLVMCFFDEACSGNKYEMIASVQFGVFAAPLADRVDEA